MALRRVSLGGLILLSCGEKITNKDFFWPTTIFAHADSQIENCIWWAGYLDRGWIVILGDRITLDRIR